MASEPVPTGPDPEAIIRTILERWPETDVVSAHDAWFFSLDPQKHWPNFATIVTTDVHDTEPVSRLTDRPGVFRLNIGVGRTTFERVVGWLPEPDFAAFDTFVPHPVYAKQLWVSILNPSEATFRDCALPLLEEAHDRVASTQARHAPAGSTEAG